MDTILCQRRESTSQVCFWEACLLFPVETNHTIHPQTNTTTNRPHIASHAVAPETIWTLNVKVTLKNVIALEQSSLNSTCLSHFVLGLKANLRACVKFTQVTFIMLMFHNHKVTMCFAFISNSVSVVKSFKTWQKCACAIFLPLFLICYLMQSHSQILSSTQVYK